MFVGRQWLYGEALEHLTSDLPTNRGVIVTGAAGTGKTAVILKLVELSCFGRGEPIYQGKLTILVVVSYFNCHSIKYKKEHTKYKFLKTET